MEDLLLDSPHFSIAVLGSDGRLVQANRAFFHLHPGLQLGLHWSPAAEGAEATLRAARDNHFVGLVDTSAAEPLPTAVEFRHDRFLVVQRRVLAGRIDGARPEHGRLDLSELLPQLAGWVEDLDSGELTFGHKALPCLGADTEPPRSREAVLARVCPEDRPQLQRAVDAVLAGAQISEAAVSLCLPGAPPQLVCCRVFSRRDEVKHLRWLVCSITEASEVVFSRSNGALLLFDDILEKVADIGTWEVDVAEQSVSLDRRMAQMLELGDAPARISVREMLARIHPEDRSVMTRSWTNLTAADVSARTPQIWTCRVLVAQGAAVKYLRGSHRVLSTQPGGYTRVFGTSADMTELRNSRQQVTSIRQRLELLVDVSQLGVWEQAGSLQTLTWNDQLFKLLGREPGSVPEHVAYVEHFPAEDRTLLENHLASDQAVNTHTLRLNAKRLDGALRQFSWRGKALKDPSGRFVGAIGAVSDITEVVQAERMAQEKAAVEFASRAKSELLTRLSHELRTPLNAILGFAQLMEMRDEEEEGSSEDREFAGNIHAAGAQLLRLVNEVLELASIDSNDFLLECTSVDLKQSVQTVLRSQAAEAARNEVTLAGAAPVTFALCDEVRLLQVLGTLVSNAIRYNRAGGSVEVRVATVDQKAVVEVLDTGVGMTKTQQAKLFQPFERMSGADAKHLQGAGLSLVIARRLVDKMNGTLELASTAGVGTKVTLRLPLAEARVASASEQAQQLEKQRGMSGNILYVEDNMLNVLVMKGIVAFSKGLNLFVAHDLEQAVEVARTERLDLVLVDLLLPDTTGYEVREALVEAGVTAPFIAVTAHVLERERTRAQDEGFVDFWPKPLDAKQVRARMSQYL